MVLDPPARVGVALLGCGAWGMNHLRVWHELGCLRVACDLDPARLEAVRAGYPEVDRSADPDATLARRDVDAVVVATPASTHAAVAAAALRAGKDVLVEKPLALTAAEGRGLADLAGRSGQVLLVGHVLEYHPAVRTLRELLRAGTLGRLQYLYAHRLNLGRIRTEENALWSFAPHDLAIMLRLVGGPPEEVACHGAGYLSRRVADVTLTSLRFASEVRGHVFVSWLHPFKEQRFVVVGERQMAVFDDTAPWPEKLLLYPHQVEWVDGRVPVARKADAVTVPLEAGEPLLAECEEFLRCVTAREQPLTDAGSGLAVLEILERAQRSLELGGQPQRAAERAAGFSVHHTATVDPGAEIGQGTHIWHYSHVMPGARLGRNCVVGQNVYVGRDVRIGEGVKIQNNVSVYESVELEDHVFCGPSAVFTNVVEPRSEIERKHEFRRTLVRRGASLGANCTIVPGVTIGRYAFVGAGAVVTRDVPDQALVVGVPARIVDWVCECGVRLGLTGEEAACRACGRRYRRAGAGVQPA